MLDGGQGPVDIPSAAAGHKLLVRQYGRLSEMEKISFMVVSFWNIQLLYFSLQLWILNTIKMISTNIQWPFLHTTDAYNILYQQGKWATCHGKLMNNIFSTLLSGGTFLIAVDTAGRVLELASMLDSLWRNQESGLRAYSLVICIYQISYALS